MSKQKLTLAYIKPNSASLLQSSNLATTQKQTDDNTQQQNKIISNNSFVNSSNANKPPRMPQQIMPKLSDYRNQQIPPIIKHHHSQAQLNPQSIIFTYNYPFSKKNMEKEEQQTLGKFFDRRKNRTSLNGQVEFNLGGEEARVGTAQKSSVSGSNQEMAGGYARPQTRSQASEVQGQFPDAQKFNFSPASSLHSAMTTHTHAMGQVSRLVDLQEMFGHYKKLEQIGQALKDKQPDQVLQKLIDSYQRHIQKEKLQNYKKWALLLLEIVATFSEGKQDILNFSVNTIHQNECFRRIKQQNKIISELFLNKILKGKQKSFTKNFILFLQQINKCTPQKIISHAIYLLETNKNKRIQTPVAVEGEDEEVIDQNFEYQSAFDVPLASQNLQTNESRRAIDERQVTAMQAFLGKQQEKEQGGYLPKIPIDKEHLTYTLVLDLDETLIHFDQQRENDILANNELAHDSKLIGGAVEQLIHFRPYLHEFLEEMSQYFEVVIFTAALQDYADYILDLIDPEHKLISFRLYRQHATQRPSDGVFMKDLSKLGRDLRRVIIIDNVKENFTLQKENGIFVNTWLNDYEDKFLMEITPLLRQIVVEKVTDVRESLRTYRDSVIRYIQNTKTTSVTSIEGILAGTRPI